MRAFPKDFAIIRGGLDTLCVSSRVHRAMINNAASDTSAALSGDAIAVAGGGGGGPGMGAKVGVATRRGRGAREGAPVCI